MIHYYFIILKSQILYVLMKKLYINVIRSLVVHNSRIQPSYWCFLEYGTTQMQVDEREQSTCESQLTPFE